MIPNFEPSDSPVTEESYCQGCVTEEEAKRFKDLGVPMELCEDCVEEIIAEQKWDERFEKG